MIISKPGKVYSISSSKPAGSGRAGFGRVLFINQPLVHLFASSFIVLFVGMGLFPILPLYASQFGATKTMIGVYFSAMYISNAVGSMLPAWLADRVTRKSLFVGASALGVPALLLLAEAAALWQVIVLTAILWFSGGVVMGLVGVFTGLYSNGGSRGKSFSLMSLPMPMGTLIGGAAVGELVIWKGYSLMFTVLGGIWTALPLIGLLLLKDKQMPKAATPAKVLKAQPKFSNLYYLLLASTLVSTVAISAGRLGISLSMQSFKFSATEIASSATVSGLFTIPLTFLMGALSDRLGRDRFLITSYLLAAIGAFTLVSASQLWQFWLAATLLLVALSVSGAMTSALVTDALEREALTRGLSWLKGLSSMAAIISFTSAGFLFDNYGPISLYLVATLLPLISAGVLEVVGCKPKRILPLPTRLRTQIFCM
jgi:MFS family permease